MRISDWSSDVCSSDLIIWLVKKDTLPFVDDQGKEALNFNITVGIAFFVLFLLAVLTLGIRLVIAIPLWIIIGIAWLVFTIIAATKANDGVAYRYPFSSEERSVGEERFSTCGSRWSPYLLKKHTATTPH